jgi:hypothetical protein
LVGGAEEAARAHNARTVEYLIGTPLVADFLEEALSKLGYSCGEFEINLAVIGPRGISAAAIGRPKLSERAERANPDRCAIVRQRIAPNWIAVMQPTLAASAPGVRRSLTGAAAEPS